MNSKPTITAALAERHFITDEGWSEGEFERLMQALPESPLDQPTTTDEWEWAATEFNAGRSPWCRCGECGSYFYEPTPAGRCPHEADHEEHVARLTLTLTMDLEGAAFDDGWADEEAATLLRNAARDVRRIHDRDGWIKGEAVAIIDTNGNRVGEFVVEVR